MLAPGLVAGGLLAFTLSMDDFVITFFVAGPGATTLPIRVYSMIKHGSPPLINALSTILLALTFAAVAVSQRLSRRSSRGPDEIHADQPSDGIPAWRPSSWARRCFSPGCGGDAAGPPRLHLGGLCQAGPRARSSRRRTGAGSSSTPSIPTRRCTPSSRPGAAGYDLLTPTSYMVSLMNSQGMLRRWTGPVCRTSPTSTPIT